MTGPHARGETANNATNHPNEGMDAFIGNLSSSTPNSNTIALATSTDSDPLSSQPPRSFQPPPSAIVLQQKGHARNRYWQVLYGFILQHIVMRGGQMCDEEIFQDPFRCSGDSWRFLPLNGLLLQSKSINPTMDEVTADPNRIPSSVAAVVVVDKSGQTLFSHASGKRGVDTNEPMTLEHFCI